jgi:hypothetical protein
MKGIYMRNLALVFGLLVSTMSFGTDFCDGFEEGYKAVKGSYALVPLCPLEPITPISSTPYREGLKAGMKAAR